VTEDCSFSTLPESTQNVRVTCERDLRKQVGAMRAGLSGSFSFLVAFSLFSITFHLWTLKPASSVTKSSSGSSGCYAILIKNHEVT
jgi:hypothetical protein